MISETTIITLQALSAFFMGYEYFISIRFHDYLDNKLRSALVCVDRDLKDSIESKVDRFWKSFGYVPATFIFVFASISIFIFLKTLKAIDVNNVFLLLGILVVMFFGYCAVLGIGKILEIILPLIVLRIIEKILIFLLRCPKGVMAGFGMCFLIASFVCRYINEI